MQGMCTYAPDDCSITAQVRLFLEAYTGQFVPLFYKMLRQPQAAEEHRAKLESVLKASFFPAPPKHPVCLRWLP